MTVTIWLRKGGATRMSRINDHEAVLLELAQVHRRARVDEAQQRAPAIERRDRQQVEDQQEHVDHNEEDGHDSRRTSAMSLLQTVCPHAGVGQMNRSGMATTTAMTRFEIGPATATSASPRRP